ncbi:hypothetical protein ALQ53_200045 [Pseudomonas cannabina]|uniref:Uncharacterized protein n=2 Tax=Pseudomonas cannabina TaxID=86840 RepID=A0AB37QE33_PSECA|nr:hypothetical protein [Pseudomonas cannabina]MBM0142500.1 hypothetical protein [Pseudomonas cannabina pv. alisalensis]RMN84224.1 hypothetical protein ALQ53_200045 [Pseudomonas cannabina]
MNHQERFTQACQVADFESHPGTLGGYKVWDVTEIVKGAREELDGPYFTEAEAEIAAELWCATPDRRRARARASIHCSAWNPSPAREVAIREDAMAARMILAELIGAEIPKPTASRL